MTSFTALTTMDTNERKNYMVDHGKQVLSDMLNHIGNADNELHDKIVYRLFCEIISEELLTKELLKELIFELPTDKYLYANISSTNDDTVFTRSFAALWLACLLNYDNRQPFLTEQEAIQVMEASIHYLSKEQDVRGFVEGKGWAHSMAHGADLAVTIVAHRHFQLRFAPIILQGVKSALWKGTVFIDDEEERLAKIFAKLIAIDFPEEILIEWVEQVFDKLDVYFYEVGYTETFFHARTNTLRFIRMLYFTAKFSNKAKQLQAVTSIFINKWV